MHLKANKLKRLGIAFSLPVLLSAGTAQAQWEGSLTFASDYLYNGVSQTDEKPALQLDIYRYMESGWYVGAFASNIDFGDDNSFEFDIYGGREWALSDELTFEIGALYYTYQPDDSSYNYAEFTTAVSHGPWRGQIWYAPDYAGTGAGHWIYGVSYEQALSAPLTARVGFHHSSSADTQKLTWGGKRGYDHLFVELTYDLSPIAFTLGVHYTSLPSAAGGGNTAVAAVSWSF